VKKLMALIVAVMVSLAFCGVVMAAPYGDIVFVADESGSMSGEHAWMGSMVTSLESELVAQSLSPNNYGLVGYGTSYHDGGTSQVPHKHLVGGASFGTAAQLSTATSGLIANGGTEDGWRAINYAITEYAYRAAAAKNLILITDEDRDNTDATLTYSGILASLTGGNFLLNVVVDAAFRTAAGAVALGIDADGNAYVADGFGGYIKSAGGFVVSGFGTTINDYINLALATGGAAWDLNQLRSGGLTATSFTEAFVDIKVQEIIIQPTPEPMTLLLLGLGVLGLAGLRKRD